MIPRESRELYARTGKFDAACREFVYGKDVVTKTFGDFVAAMESEEREKFRSAQEIVPRYFFRLSIFLSLSLSLCLSRACSL